MARSHDPLKPTFLPWWPAARVSELAENPGPSLLGLMPMLHAGREWALGGCGGLRCLALPAVLMHARQRRLVRSVLILHAFPAGPSLPAASGPPGSGSASGPGASDLNLARLAWCAALAMVVASLTLPLSPACPVMRCSSSPVADRGLNGMPQRFTGPLDGGDFRMTELDQDLQWVTRAQGATSRRSKPWCSSTRRRVERLIARMVRDTDLVEDIAQEAFLKAYRALPQFRVTVPSAHLALPDRGEHRQKTLMSLGRDPLIYEASRPDDDEETSSEAGGTN